MSKKRIMAIGMGICILCASAHAGFWSMYSQEKCEHLFKGVAATVGALFCCKLFCDVISDEYGYIKTQRIVQDKSAKDTDTKESMKVEKTKKTFFTGIAKRPSRLIVPVCLAAGTYALLYVAYASFMKFSKYSKFFQFV